ncbi:MAG: DUF805 domain-containing protein [Thermoguttaceae bacterium]|nr:DUF805 domain-containing protein [Thermoguttaceae bacterium]
MSKVCDRCGAKFNADIHFCGLCGADLAEGKPNPNANPGPDWKPAPTVVKDGKPWRYCPKCKTKLASKLAFCPLCGTKVAEPAPPAAKKPAESAAGAQKSEASVKPAVKPQPTAALPVQSAAKPAAPPVLSPIYPAQSIEPPISTAPQPEPISPAQSQFMAQQQNPAFSLQSAVQPIEALQQAPVSPSQPQFTAPQLGPVYSPQLQYTVPQPTPAQSEQQQWAPMQPAIPAQRACIKCGSILDSRMTRCPVCGTMEPFHTSAPNIDAMEVSTEYFGAGLYCIKNMNTNGRARRREICGFVLSAICGLFAWFPIVGILAALFIPLCGENVAQVAFSVGFAFYFLFVLITLFFVSVRRLHDIGLSGWALLIGLIPGIGELAIFVLLYLVPGQPHANGYGAPKLSKFEYEAQKKRQR